MKLTHTKLTKTRLTAREVLDELNAWFQAGIDAGETQGAESTETAKLWNILSALRGPDTDSDDDKRNATLAIRKAALPVSINWSWPIEPRTEGVVYTHPKMQYHFRNHAEMAARALGLRVELL